MTEAERRPLTVPPAGWRPAPDLLAGRVVLVSGAGRGIGRAVAVAAAGHGATVILCGERQAELEATCDTITGARLPTPLLHPLDLEQADQPGLQALADALIERFDRLDGLVYASALLGPLTPLSHYPPLEWARVMHVNLSGAYLLLHALLPALARSPAASVVLASCDVGRRARAYWGAYAVAKAGLEQLALVASAELAAAGRVRVNALDPGPTRTALWRQAFPAADPERVPSPAARTDAFLYLLAADRPPLWETPLSARASEP